jgi:hypothetical protein
MGIRLAEDVPAPKQTLLSEAVAEYLAEVKESKAPKTFLAYSLTMKLFAATVQAQFLEQIDRKDVLAFIRAMRVAWSKSSHHCESHLLPQYFLPPLRTEITAPQVGQG